LFQFVFCHDWGIDFNHTKFSPLPGAQEGICLLYELSIDLKHIIYYSCIISSALESEIKDIRPCVFLTHSFIGQEKRETPLPILSKNQSN
jgi:hypothetical protein